MNPRAWRGLKYPDSEVVALVHRFARPARDVPERALAIDEGCGSGRHVRFLEEMGYRAIGIDADPEMVATARANGVNAVAAQAQEYAPDEMPALVLCWGFMMLNADGPQIVSEWGPAIAIADWRPRSNTCYSWPGNEPLPSGAVRLHNPGHVLHGLEYRFHDLRDCMLPNYERAYWQHVIKANADERNEWWQTVHRRA